MTHRRTINSRHTIRCRGLGLAEALISLALGTSLLVAVAAAFTASSNATEINDRFFQSTQTARIGIDSIMRQVRTCVSVKSVAAGAIELLNSDGTDKTWQFNPATANTPGQLVVIDNIAGTTSVLATNVSTCRFSQVTGTDANNHSVFVELSLVLTISVDTNQISLSGSAAPRASLVYSRLTVAPSDQLS